jgi:hypothetical protein
MLSAKMQISNNSDDMFWAGNNRLKQLCFDRFYSRQEGKEANSCAKRVT